MGVAIARPAMPLHKARATPPPLFISTNNGRGAPARGGGRDDHYDKSGRPWPGGHIDEAEKTSRPDENEGVTGNLLAANSKDALIYNKSNHVRAYYLKNK